MIQGRAIQRMRILGALIALFAAGVDGQTARDDSPGGRSNPTTAPTTGPGAPDSPRAAAARSTTDLNALKAELKSTDEEWKVIGPQLRKVMAAREATLTSLDSPESTTAPTWPGFRGFGGGGGGGGFGPPGGFGGGGTAFNGPGGTFGPPGGGPPGGGQPGGGGPTTRRDNGQPARDFGPGGGDFGRFGGPPDGPSTRPAAPGDSPAPRFGSPQTQPADSGPLPTTRPGGFGGPPQGGPGFGPMGFGRRPSALKQAMDALHTQLQDPTSTSEQINKLVEAVRAARQHATAELEKSQKALIELLTPEQQAVLISRGYLN